MAKTPGNSGTFVAVDDGELVAEIAHQRLRHRQADSRHPVPPESFECLRRNASWHQKHLLRTRNFNKHHCEWSPPAHSAARQARPRQAGPLVPGDLGHAGDPRGNVPVGLKRAAAAVAMHCTRHIGAAREREKVYSSSGTVNSTSRILGERRQLAVGDRDDGVPLSRPRLRQSPPPLWHSAGRQWQPARHGGPSSAPSPAQARPGIEQDALPLQHRQQIAQQRWRCGSDRNWPAI